MLSQTTFECVHQGWGQHHNGTVINVDCSDSESSILFTLKKHSLIDITPGEFQLSNKDLYQAFVPTVPTLLQTIQGFDQMADPFFRMVIGYKFR
jgi:hypothetical protein